VAVDRGSSLGRQGEAQDIERALKLAPERGGQSGQGRDVRRERFSLAVQACLLGR
jgi:hypothetical protein